jgi:hypothetical protein
MCVGAKDRVDVSKKKFLVDLRIFLWDWKVLYRSPKTMGIVLRR